MSYSRYDRGYAPVRGNARDLRLTGHLVYGLYAVALVTAVPLFIGVIVAYLKRGATAGTIYASHMTWAIRTFWGFVLANIVGWLLVWTFILMPIGWAVLGLGWLWTAYRVARGWLTLIDDRPMYRG